MQDPQSLSLWDKLLDGGHLDSGGLDRYQVYVTEKHWDVASLSLAAERNQFGLRCPRHAAWLCHVLAVWPWLGVLATLSLGYIISNGWLTLEKTI